MEQNLRAIEAEIRQERRRLDRNLAELEEQARSLADWRTHYRNYPLAAIGIAAGTGLVLGLAMSGGEAGHERVDDSRPSRSMTQRTKSVLAHLDPQGRAGSHVGDTWDRILDALLGVAASAAVKFVSQRVEGFQEEFERRSGVHG